jgi:hypothetical protein
MLSDSWLGRAEGRVGVGRAAEGEGRQKQYRYCSSQGGADAGKETKKREENERQ